MSNDISVLSEARIENGCACTMLWRGQLGRHEAARKALQELLTLRPDFGNSVRRDYEKWWDSKTIDHLIEGLRRAGLEIP